MAEHSGPVLVLDIETQNTFADVGGKQNLHKLKISVVCVYNYDTDQYLSYTEDQLFELEQLLRQARLVIGFNIRSFDFGVLRHYLFTPENQFPILDLLEDIEKARGHRVSLESIAQATFNARKTGDGLDAVRMFREGRMKELIDYCIHDVKLTKEVYEYGKKHGKVLFRSYKDFNVYEVPVNWRDGAAETAPAGSQFPASLF